QRQAIALTQCLNKIDPTEPLSSSNHMSWSSQIKSGLGSLYLDGLLESDEDDSKVAMTEALSNEVARKCLTSWLLRHMDADNRRRFEPAIKVYGPNRSMIDSKPSKLWNTIESHYTNRSEVVKLILKGKLDKMSQGPRQDLCKYIDMYHKAVSDFKEANSHIEDDELGRKLLASLN
ncbi:hypothetical protein CROQUDRAFT_14359, partial [Cronartium quercuum f. sp. fusiforme G11]